MAEDLLLQAETLVQDFVRQLDVLLRQARQRQQTLETQARQIHRYLEEVDVRLRLGQGGGVPGGLDMEQLQAERDAAARQEQAILTDLAEAEERNRRLDLLRRQVEMSGSSLRSESGPRPYDPWDLALRSQVVYGREQERAALAREVHDGPAQVLANSVLGLERCRQASALGDAHAMADGLLRDVRLGLQEVRRFIYELRPSPLADEPLARQVERYVHDLEAAYQIRLELRWADPPRALSPEENIVVYRVVQEALQNARKHAQAECIQVEAYVEPTGWVVRISDNGVGFNPTKAMLQEDHWGLRGMRERAQLIDAELAIESRPQEGTAVTLRLPFQPPEWPGGRS